MEIVISVGLQNGSEGNGECTQDTGSNSQPFEKRFVCLSPEHRGLLAFLLILSMLDSCWQQEEQ